MKHKILTVVGTRPNFVKVTQFPRYLNDPEKGLSHKIVHTGQHYDTKMADVFFEQFQLAPDYWMNVPPGSPNSQIAKIMLGMEKIILEDFAADMVLVVGDVNSTLAAALAAHKLGIPVGHIESGLRSFDRGMPEEINRLITDEISDYFFITEESARKNLIKEGKPEDKMFFVGNTMIDTLVHFEPEIDAAPILQKIGVSPQSYVLMTIHRPATVDNPEGLSTLLTMMREITQQHAVVFPIHPRTRNNFHKFGLSAELESIQGLILTEPLDYFAFQKLIKESSYVLTDSGGIQEETTFRKVPCLTLRPNTERPVTIEEGTNSLVPFELEAIFQKIREVEAGNQSQGRIPHMWDGKATIRIAEAVSSLF